MSVLLKNESSALKKNAAFLRFGKRQAVRFDDCVGRHFGPDSSGRKELRGVLQQPQINVVRRTSEDFQITELSKGRIGPFLLRVHGVDSLIKVNISENWSAFRWAEMVRGSSSPLAKWREEIRAFASLAKGWDSYNAGPPSKVAIDIALEIIDVVENLGVSPDYVIPTSDESILFKHAHGDSSYLWEIESDGEIGLMIESADGTSTFHGVNRSQILIFLDEREENV
jgi:hypothetical protein